MNYTQENFTSKYPAQIEKALFKVLSKPTYYSESHDVVHGKVINQYEPIPNMKTLTRVDGSYISTVNSKYSVIQNETILLPVIEQMKSSLGSETFDKAVIETDIFNNGLLTYVKFVFPNISRNIKTTNGHETNLQFRTYLRLPMDSKKAVTLYVGNIDSFCWNGMISGNYDIIRQAHRGKIEIGNFEQAFATSRENYLYDTEKFSHMAKAPMRMVTWTTKSFFLDTLVYGTDQTTWPENNRRKLSNNILERWHTESMGRGDNVYALVSALTDYARKGSRLEEDKGRYNRENKVRKWMESNTWKDMCDQHGIAA